MTPALRALLILRGGVDARVAGVVDFARVIDARVAGVYDMRGGIDARVAGVVDFARGN